MIIKNVSELDLKRAIAIVNEKYEDNIEIFIESRGKNLKVNLRVKNANKKNGSIAGRKLNQSQFMGYTKGAKANGSACWHVHGDFFDTLLDINPKAIIETSLSAIYKNEYGLTVGNWEDKNIGSLMNPVLYSECCEC